MTLKTDQNKSQLILLIIFFFSGIAGLAYQILWVKLLSQMFGHTIFAISTVVATFMAGLAIGSFIFGRYVDRSKSPLRLYALLELGIGLYAFMFLQLYPLFNDIYIALFKYFDLGFATFSISRFIFAFLILIIPTALIGGTFPVIARYYIRNVKEVKKDTGLLYAVNTLGAVSGALITGFVLLEWFGISVTNDLMVAINLLLALIVWRFSAGDELPLSFIEEKKKDKNVSFILIIYAISGFVSLSLEVLWTRELSIVFLSSTYSFSTVLVTFLIGLTIGSFIISSKKIKINNAITYFYRIQYGIAIMALLSIPFLRYFPQKLYIEAVATQTITWKMEILFNFAVSFLVLIIPTLLMGAAFPLVCSIYTRTIKNIGNDLGIIYAFNTTGAILGSLIAGFLLIPWFGVVTSISIVSVIAFLISVAVIIKYTSFRESRLEHLFLVIVFFMLFFGINVKGDGFRPLPEGTKVLYSKEDIGAEVKVLKDEQGEIALYINEKQQGGTLVSQTERWTGQIPLIFYNSPDSILLIGLGTGVTLNAITEGPVKHVTCVDLIGSLVEAAELFKDINGNVLKKDDRVKFVEADGINFLDLVSHKYDLIICDIVHPDDAGAGDLYSLEFYQRTRAGLKKNGIFVQWVILDQLATEDLKTILATFYHVFPDMQLYLGQEQNIYQKLMLMGSVSEKRFQFKEISDNLKRLQFSIEFAGKDNPYSFLSFFVTDGLSMEEEFSQVSLNSRDHPIIEYQSPKHKWLIGKSIHNLNYLNRIRQPVYKQIVMDSVQTQICQQYFNARSLILRGRLEEYTGDSEAADISYSRAALIDVDTLLVSYLLAGIAFEFVEEKKSDLAITAFKKSIAVNHRNTGSSFALAEFLSRLGNFDEAFEFYKYTVHQNPTHSPAYRKMGDYYSKNQEFDNALYCYRMSLDINNNQPILHYICGQIYFNHKSDYGNAARNFQISLEQNPYHRYSQQAYDALRKLESLIEQPKKE